MRGSSGPRYDWERDVVTEAEELAARGVVIVEGVYSSRRELAPLYDLRVWLECPRTLRLARGLERDGEDAHARWEHDWMPAEDRYVLEHAPQAHADIIVRGEPSSDAVAAQPAPARRQATKATSQRRAPAILVVTGVSGAGKTSAVRCLEARPWAVFAVSTSTASVCRP